MTKISYSVGNQTGSILWAAAEQFSELKNQKFSLGDMEAVEIEKRQELSLTAKILLSAVAGAVIQHLLDQGIQADEIFSSGTFTIEFVQ